MEDHLLKILYLRKKLIYKRESGQLSELDKIAFQKIDWYSLPLMYSHFDEDLQKFYKEAEKRKRVKKRVNAFLHDLSRLYCDSTIYFVTLTFDDHALSLKEKSRHEYVKSFVNKTTRAYIANIDYGSKNQREHYHVVCVFKRSYDTISSVRLEWTHGFSHFKVAGISDEDSENKNKYRISSYILKLTNHAGKMSAGKVFKSKVFDDVDFIDEMPF